MTTMDSTGEKVAILYPASMARQPTSAAGEPESAYQKLLSVGIALSAERDRDRLLEMIVEHAMSITGADAGCLFLVGQDDTLSAAIVRARSTDVAYGGTTGKEAPFPPIPLYQPDSGAPNHASVESYVALTGTCINVADAYSADGFDFSGTRACDARTGYRSISFLSVPLKTREETVIGVLQLINAGDAGGHVVPFDPALQPVVEALASQASVALENQRLLQNQRELFDSLVRMLAAAIDAKSPYTGAHCQRVPVIYELLADAACESREGVFVDFDLTEEERDELHVAAWLHDCGKVATPEYIVDKATKLETVRDRMHEVSARFEVVKREEEILSLQNVLKDPENIASYRADLYTRLRKLDEDYWFLTTINRGDGYMTDEMIERVRSIATLRWRDQSGLARPLLDADEVENLCIREGTLNEDERQIVNRHVEVSIDMLNELPFPESLRQVPEIAGAHHEKIDGSGYPNGLVGSQMSLPARMLVIADIFEALTAGDRPYKKAKTLRESLFIMAEMRDQNKIDGEVFELFLTSRVWQTYAEQYMPSDLRNGVDIAPLLAHGSLRQTESATKVDVG